MVTRNDGMITFDGLEAGTYTLEETQPAPGYEKVDTKWKVRIDPSGKVFIKDANPNADLIVQHLQYQQEIEVRLQIGNNP